MKIEKIMSQSVVSVETDDTLKEIKTIFSNTTFHHLLVVRSSKLVGVISDRDLFKSISPNLDTAAETSKDLATLNKKAHQIMSRDPITLDKNADIFEAVDVFNKNRISCIPIVDQDNRPLGILSWRDIFKIIKQ